MLGLTLLPSLACAQAIDTPYAFTTLAGQAETGGGAIEAWSAAMLALLATARVFSRFS